LAASRESAARSNRNTSPFVEDREAFSANGNLHSVYFGLQSKNATVCDNALEFLEGVPEITMRAISVPLLDGKVSPKQRAAIAERFVRAKVGNREQAVAELVGSDDP
jgi:hypothetical protein